MTDEECVMRLQLSKVPHHLKRGAVYSSFLLKHDDTFEAEFPLKYYCSGTHVSSPETFNHLLDCLQYWGVPELPEDVVHHVLQYSEEYFDLVVPYIDSFPEIASILRVLSTDHNERLLAAIDLRCSSIVTWLLRNGYAPNSLHVTRAKELNDPILPRLKDGDRCYAAAYQAATKGDAKTLKLFLFGDLPRAELSELAAAAGSLECLELLCRKRFDTPATAAINAAKCGSLPCLQFLHGSGALWHHSVCYHAACGGHLDCLQFAFGLVGLQGAMRWDRDMEYVRGAVEHRRAECLAYLLSQGCRGDATVPATAAHNGDLACLRVLHEHGCPWDARTVQAAVLAGHSECVQFALEHGCSLTGAL